MGVSHPHGSHHVGIRPWPPEIRVGGAGNGDTELNLHVCGSRKVSSPGMGTQTGTPTFRQAGASEPWYPLQGVYMMAPSCGRICATAEWRRRASVKRHENGNCSIPSVSWGQKGQASTGTDLGHFGRCPRGLEPGRVGRCRPWIGLGTGQTSKHQVAQLGKAGQARAWVATQNHTRATKKGPTHSPKPPNVSDATQQGDATHGRMPPNEGDAP